MGFVRVLLILALTGCVIERGEEPFWSFSNESDQTVMVHLLSSSGPDPRDAFPADAEPPFPMAPGRGFTSPVVDERPCSALVLSVTDAAGRELPRVPNTKLCDRVIVVFDGTKLVLRRR